jgi:glycosyltransferase involved in cell wall biosynthesis
MVIGGDRDRMPRELPPDVAFQPARTVTDVFRALWPLRNVDVLHAHMTAAELPCALLKKRTGGRLVVTRHFAAPRGRTFGGRLAGRIVRRRIDRQLSISQFVADSIGEPSTVVYNGVAAADAASTDRGQIVAVMQRFEQEKNTATALRAWAGARLASDGWRLVLYGRGAERGQLEALAEQLKIDKSIEFAGFAAEPRRHLAAAAMLVATAPAEPFGLTVVEAMAEGTPVVAAEGGAHRETLGPDGCYFAPGDADGCAAAMRKLAEDLAFRMRYGTALRRRQQTLFTVAHQVDQLETAYRS